MLPCDNPPLIELTNQKKPCGHNPWTCMWTNQSLLRHHLPKWNPNPNFHHLLPSPWQRHPSRQSRRRPPRFHHRSTVEQLRTSNLPPPTPTPLPATITPRPLHHAEDHTAANLQQIHRNTCVTTALVPFTDLTWKPWQQLCIQSPLSLHLAHSMVAPPSFSIFSTAHPPRKQINHFFISASETTPDLQLKWTRTIHHGSTTKRCSHHHEFITDNAVVDAFKLILLIYNNFSIVKKVVNKIVRVK